jgi:hypothetical protein
MHTGLRILAGVSLALLFYEMWTLGTGVLLPLLGNPTVLQTDFHYYYDAAVRFRADPSRLYQLSDDVIAGFTYPPPAILPFAALSYLQLGAALLVMTVSSYAVVTASIVLWLGYLRRHGVAFNGAAAMAAALVAIALGPTYSNAIFGQVNAWVLVCVVVFVTMGPLRPALGGAALAAGALLKIYPGLMVAVTLWNRDAWRRVVYAGLAGAAIVAIALPLVPVSAYQTFLADVLPARVDKTAVHITNQSLIAFVERFALPPERFLNWTGEQAITAGGAVRAFNWLVALAAIAWLWLRARSGGRAMLHSTAALIALAAVIAPLGWSHTYVLVLPLVILHVLSMRHGPPLYAAIVSLAVVALMIPAARRLGVIESLPAALQNVVYSRYLLATLVMIALPAAQPKRADTPAES